MVLVALLLIAFGVLAMHVASFVAAPVGPMDAMHVCHHEADCPGSPAHHLDMVCLAAVVVLVAALVLLRACVWTGTRVAVAEDARPRATFVRHVTPRLAELCILRC